MADTNNEAKWYVAHTYSGYENKVKVDLEKTIENRNLQDMILEVAVPVQSTVELKNGVEKKVDRKLFPGYVLVHMVMNDETWYVVRNTRGVTGFVGPGSKPVPLSEEEIAMLGNKEQEVVFNFDVGDTVVVVSGAWKDTVGEIKAINASKHSVTINVEMFGRETPVELSFAELKSCDCLKPLSGDMRSGAVSIRTVFSIQVGGCETPAITTRRCLIWQRKLQDTSSYRFLPVRQHRRRP